MDRLLCGGDAVLDHRGLPVMIDGERELLQQAALRLAVRRGSLPGNPDFGSGLHRLRAQNGDARDRAALLAAREALAPMVAVSVRAAGCRFDAAARRLMVHVELACEGGRKSLEVAL